MPWFGKSSDFESENERLERRIKKLEEEKRRRDDDDDFSMTSTWCGGDDE
jgi:hypothetical protein